jgi:hypothetical protein
MGLVKDFIDFQEVELVIQNGLGVPEGAGWFPGVFRLIETFPLGQVGDDSPVRDPVGGDVVDVLRYGNGLGSERLGGLPLGFALRSLAAGCTSSGSVSMKGVHEFVPGAV